MNADTVISLYQHGSLVCAGLVAVYLLARWGVGHVPFLEQPKHAHYLTIAIGVLGVFAVPAATGQAPTLAMVLSAVGTLTALLLPGLTASPPKTSQSGRVSLTLLAVLALVAVSFVGCLSSAQKQDAANVGKAAGSAAEACGISDLESYGGTVADDIAKPDYEQQLAQFATTHHFGQDAVNCLVRGVLAGVAALVGEIHGEPSPIVLHGRAYLAAHGKTAMLDVYTARWLTAWNPHCEPSTATPAVDCRPYESEHYDGCHWTCEAR